LPASAAQVFGPTTVNPGFTTTGEKTLLTMNTTLPAGGKNVIVCVFLPNSNFNSNIAYGTFRIKKGATVLTDTTVVELLNQGGEKAHGAFILAVDNNPTGNDSYTFVLNITRAGTVTGDVHVQGMVIKTSDALFNANTGYVSVAAGATATVLSLPTTYPANSKVAVLAYILSGQNSVSGPVTTTADYCRIKRDTTIISRTQFSIGMWWGSGQPVIPARTALIAYDTPPTTNPTYSVEFYNSTSITVYVFALIVAFTVTDASYLDTDAVALTNGSQVTVGSLNTTLSGDVVVIGLAVAENPNNTTVTAFNANDVVLQLNNSTIGQIGNLTSRHLESTIHHGRSAVLPLLRLDTNVSNPSYQIKMTARSSGFNGEAKILAFSLTAGIDIKKVFGETLRLLENIILRRGRFRPMSENVSIGEARISLRSRFRSVAERVNLVENVVRVRNWVRVLTEVVNLNEIFGVVRNRFRQFGEFIQISEASSRFKQLFKVFNETINLLESMSKSMLRSRVLVESVNIIENIGKALGRTRVVNEFVNLLEAVGTFRGKVLGIIENINLFENFSRIRGKLQIQTERVRISEAFLRLRNMVRVIVEQLNLSELFRVLRNMFRVAGETIRLIEAPSLMVGKFKSFMESVRITESVNIFRRLLKVIGEIVNITETVSRFRALVRMILDAVGVYEAFGIIRQKFIRIIESVNISESKSFSRILVRIQGEMVRISELGIRFLGSVKVVVESVKIIESRLSMLVKTYIKRLRSILRGMSKSGLKGSSKGGEL
jgi:hypothetical protein